MIITVLKWIPIVVIYILFGLLVLYPVFSAIHK
jgi:hypothetical protein